MGYHEADDFSDVGHQEVNPIQAKSSTPAASENAPGALRLFHPPSWQEAFDFLRRNIALVTLIVITFVFQASLFHVTVPNDFPDSGAYRDIAQRMLTGRTEYNTFEFRTPGYPSFLALCYFFSGSNTWMPVISVQFLCGSLIPVLLYFIYLRICRNTWVAAAGGLGFFLDRFSVNLQAVPLTEFLGGFTVVLALCAFLWGTDRKKYWTAVIVGLLFYLNLMIRPSFQLLVFCTTLGGFGLEMIYREARCQWKRAALWYGIVLLTTQLGVWAWSYRNYKKMGVFALSYQLGASMTNQTGSFMELAPDEFAEVRDAYIRARDKSKGNHINLYDQMAWQMIDDTGLKGWQLSLEFKKVNSWLIRHHFFDKYWPQVQFAWWRLWSDSPMYMTDLTDSYQHPSHQTLPTPQALYLLRNPFLGRIYGPIDNYYWRSPNAPRRTPYLLFLVFAIAVWCYRKSSASVIGIVIIVGTVFYHMLLHAMVQFTEFGRYRLPIQPLWVSFFVAMLAAGVSWLIHRGKGILEPEKAAKPEVAKAGETGRLGRTKRAARKGKR
ncbi:MAG: hypothetical protein K1X53_13135 [Candidatus Sumerlaeaceae bacterium]|nr:hypothetical protein [Candidatus Sumerlaeaceae bacterium]